MTTEQKQIKKENNKIKLNTAGQNERVLSLETLWFLVLMNTTMLSKRHIKVRTFSGATCSDMYHFLLPVLEKNPYYVILHIETNDVAHYEGTEIVDKLLKLKSFIVEQLPTTQVVSSHLTMRTDSKHLAMKIADLQSHLRKLQTDMIESGNINNNQ